MKITLEFLNVKIRMIKKIIKPNILIFIKIKLIIHILQNIRTKKMKIK